MVRPEKAKILRKLNPNSLKNGAKTVENRALQSHFHRFWRFWAFGAFWGGSWVLGATRGRLRRVLGRLGRLLGPPWCRLGTQDGAKSALNSFLRTLVKRRPTTFGFGRLLALIFQGFCIDLGGQDGTKSVPQTCGNRRSDTVPKRLIFRQFFRANVTTRIPVGKAPGTMNIVVLSLLA